MVGSKLTTLLLIVMYLLVLLGSTHNYVYICLYVYMDVCVYQCM